MPFGRNPQAGNPKVLKILHPDLHTPQKAQIDEIAGKDNSFSFDMDLTTT